MIYDKPSSIHKHLSYFANGVQLMKLKSFIKKCFYENKLI